MAPRISLHNEQYSAAIPAHRFRQGGRDVYCFSLDLATLDGLLPQRVDDTVIREANRRLTPSHAKNIQKYLEEREDWLLGAMLLGIAHDALEFDPYVDESGATYSDNFGELRIRNRRLNTMRIFDGQHRRRAIQDTLTVLENDRQRADKLAALEKSSVPIVLYAEEDIAALRQMFADASKTKRIEGNVVAQFNQRDAFNLAAMYLAENSKLFRGRVEMNRTTVARGSQRLLSINQLADILRTSELGYDGRNTRSRNDAYVLDINELYERCLTWSDWFMPAARKEYAAVTSGELEDRYIPQQRAESFAYSATFFRLVAGCYHDWRVRFGDWKPLAEFLRLASLEPGASSGKLLVDAGLVLPDGLSLLSRRQEVAAAIKYIVHEATATREPHEDGDVPTNPAAVLTAAPERPDDRAVSSATAEAGMTPAAMKVAAMKVVNSYLQHDVLNKTNTHFSNVNNTKDVWWFNIPPSKFEHELHLLLCIGESRLIWLTIEANSIPNLEGAFRLRPDRAQIDFEISCAAERYLRDVKSGGSGYDFGPHIRREWSREGLLSGNAIKEHRNGSN